MIVLLFDAQIKTTTKRGTHCTAPTQSQLPPLQTKQKQENEIFKKKKESLGDSMQFSHVIRVTKSLHQLFQ